MSIPMSMVPITDIMVNSIPSLPDASEACRFMPKPKPTTEYCNRYFDTFLLNLGCAWPHTMANSKPKNSATGGVTQPDKCANPGT